MLFCHPWALEFPFFFGLREREACTVFRSKCWMTTFTLSPPPPHHNISLCWPKENSKDDIFFLLRLSGWTSMLSWRGAGCWRLQSREVHENYSIYILTVPQCLSLRQNWINHPLPRKQVCHSLDPHEGGATLPCRWGGGGTQFGRLKLKSGTLYTQWF